MSDFAPRPFASSDREPERDAAASWAEAAQELRAQRDKQREAWGSVDSSTLGRYLADEVDAGERARVEAEIASHPELARLTELVRDVLADFEPDEVPAPVVPAPLLAPEPHRPIAASAPMASPAADPDEPAVLPFQPRRQRGFFSRFRHEIALAAAACVLVGLGWAVFQFASPPTDAPGVANVAMAAGQPARTNLPADSVAVASLKPLDVLDRRLSEQQQADQPVNGAYFEQAYFNVARSAGLEYHPRYAQSLEHFGNCLKDQGQLAWAGEKYEQAYNIRRDNAGPNAPETVRAANQLAGVYQLALNVPNTNDFAERGHQTRLMAPTPALHMEMAKAGPEPDVRRLRQLQDFRTKIVAQAPAKVRESVVPVLAQALRHGTSDEERLRMLQALGRLGCAARDATPLVIERYRQADGPVEKRAALLTLGRIGAEMPGVPDLLREVVETDGLLALDAGQALLDLGPAGRKQLEALAVAVRQESADLKQADKDAEARVKRLTVTLDRLRKQAAEPALASGVLDVAGLFTPQALHAAERRIDTLGRQPAGQVFIETLPEPPTEPAADERARLLGTHGLYVLVAAKPGTVQVRVGPALAKAGFDADRARELAQELERLVVLKKYDDVPARVLAALPPPKP